MCCGYVQMAQFGKKYELFFLQDSSTGSRETDFQVPQRYGRRRGVRSYQRVVPLCKEKTTIFTT